MCRQCQAEEFQHGRRDIDDGGFFFRDLAIGKEHAGDKSRIDAVVAAPGFQIVFENLRW